MGEWNPPTTRTRTLPNLPPNHQKKGIGRGHESTQEADSTDLAKLKAIIRGAALVPLQTTPAHTNPRRFFHSPRRHAHLATAQAVAALAL